MSKHITLLGLLFLFLVCFVSKSEAAGFFQQFFGQQQCQNCVRKSTPQPQTPAAETQNKEESQNKEEQQNKVVAYKPVISFEPTAAPEAGQKVEEPQVLSATERREAEEANCLALVNAERARRGLKPLTLNSALSTASRAWSMTMSSRGFFHGASQEIIAMCGGTGQSAYSIWRGSPPHWGMLMSPRYSEVGFGNHGRYWTGRFR